MRSDKAKEIFQKLLSPAGIQIDGDRPFDMRIQNQAFYTVALLRGTMGIREAYVKGWWETDQLDELTYRVLSKSLNLVATEPLSRVLNSLSTRLFNNQNRQGSLRVLEHYDRGNDLFCAMLDKRLVYSCGYWQKATTLDEAQEAKLDLVCRKLALKPGMRVLDIGCGWGSFAKFAAENYGVSVVGINISQEQLNLGKTLCSGLPIELRLQDYRDLNESFDAIVSLGMFEHVGLKNYRQYMQVVRKCLKSEGLFLLQTIGCLLPQYSTDVWINKYIFPNGMLPTAQQIASAGEGLLIIEDWHNFGADYDKTLMAWFKNFDSNWSKLKDKYSDQFYRMWKCYLLTFAGVFRSRGNQLWQIVFSPSGIPGGYTSLR